MHELSLAESAVALIEEAAARERFERVRVVRLEVGALACVEVGALRTAFAAAGAGTRADGAELRIATVPGVGSCRGCGTTSPMEEQPALCPGCGVEPLRVVSGTRLRVLDLVVE